jgi:hypothetical protein
LPKKALRVESRIESNLRQLDHIYNRIDLASGRLNPFVGRGTSTGGGRDPIYNIDELKNSMEFIRTCHTLISEQTRIISRSKRIARHLENFLAVLEDTSSLRFSTTARSALAKAESSPQPAQRIESVQLNFLSTLFGNLFTPSYEQQILDRL